MKRIVLPKTIDRLGMKDFPRRNCVDLDTPIEKEIRAVARHVDQMDAHPLLTDAVNLLEAAKDKVSDFLELEQP